MDADCIRAGTGKPAGGIHTAVEQRATEPPIRELRHDWSIVREDPFPYGLGVVVAATATLRELVQRWEELPVGGGLEFRWPDRLARPVPPEAGHRTGARR